MEIFEREEELKNLKDVLNQTIIAIKNRNLALLRDLSNRTIHSASIYKDLDSISIAVIIFTMSKLLGRTDYYEDKDFNDFIRAVIDKINLTIGSVKQKNHKQFHKDLKGIIEIMNKKGGKLNKYIQQVFREAQISKASRLYEHGISREETAEVLGIGLWELAEYVGTTGIADTDLSFTKPLKERINLAKQLFA